ncbi:hypothetical protein ZTR_02360 [Talaromyces verruculosus]|nr:hypothetical protein ZTR_02360 [Talaromyces verruculosus]
MSNPASNAARKRSASVDSPVTERNDDSGLRCTLSHEYLKTDPAFNPSVVAKAKPPAISTSANIKQRLPHARAAKAASKGLATNILHPRRTIIQQFQTKTAKSLSRATRPYITPQADREFLAAHDALFEAKKDGERKPPHKPRNKGRRTEEKPDERKRVTDSTGHIPPETEAEVQSRKIELLEAHRQSIIVAWITSRHMKAVRVTPSRIADFPRLDDERFIERDASGNEVSFKWDRYLGQVSMTVYSDRFKFLLLQLFLYYSQPFMARYVEVDEWKSPLDIVTLTERLVVASEPWQEWWMGIRDLYRWERPQRTAFWYGVFSILWYTQHVVGFVYAYIIYITLKNKLYPHDVNSMRESLDRSLDRGAQAYRFGELVDRYGREKWLEPLLDQMAPFIRLQLGDLVAFLEITRNFYYWRDPLKTAATLFFFFSCLLVALLTDAEFCMKVVWFIAINVFFLCWPIASRYPRYRYLVSPFRWIFWDIPSYPEWAIRFLQEHEVLRRHEIRTRGLAHNENCYSEDCPTCQEAQGDVFQDAVETQDQLAKGSPIHGIKCTTQGDDTASPYVQSVFFATFHHGHEGQLILTSEGIQFVEKPNLLTTLHKQKPLLDREPRWSYTYGQLLQMTKQHSPRLSKLTGLDRKLERLEFEFLTDTETSASQEVFRMETSYHSTTGGKQRTIIESVDVNQAERDEIFNLIVGWSKSRWQATSGQSDSTKK